MATYTSALNLKKPAGGENVLIGDINGNMDAIDAEAIRSRANFAGTYDASSSYSVGDYCIYGGNLFRCTTAIGSGGETWTTGHWTQVAVGEELTTLNGKIANIQEISTSSGASSYPNGVFPIMIPTGTTISGITTSINMRGVACNTGSYLHAFVSNVNDGTTYAIGCNVYTWSMKQIG